MLQSEDGRPDHCCFDLALQVSSLRCLKVLLDHLPQLLSVEDLLSIALHSTSSSRFISSGAARDVALVQVSWAHLLSRWLSQLARVSLNTCAYFPAVADLAYVHTCKDPRTP